MSDRFMKNRAKQEYLYHDKIEKHRNNCSFAIEIYLWWPKEIVFLPKMRQLDNLSHTRLWRLLPQPWLSWTRCVMTRCTWSRWWRPSPPSSVTRAERPWIGWATGVASFSLGRYFWKPWLYWLLFFSCQSPAFESEMSCQVAVDLLYVCFVHRRNTVMSRRKASAVPPPPSPPPLDRRG